MAIRPELFNDLIEPLIGLEFDTEAADLWLRTPEAVNLVARSARIAPNVVMGTGNVVMPGVLITGNTYVGNQNIFLGAVQVGAPSRQRLEVDPFGPTPYKRPRLTIGSDNIFEDHVSIHQPVATATVIEDSVSIGAGCHIAHDCHIQRDVVIAANCSLGGYTWLGRRANLGLSVAVHPRTAVGALAMCGAGSVVVRHILPAATVVGAPARYLGLNRRGLRRADASSEVETAFARSHALGRAYVLDDCISLEYSEFWQACARWNRDCGTIPSVTP